MRNVNWELKQYKPTWNPKILEARWANSFKKKVYKFIRCPECQKYMYGDNSIMQEHMLNTHVKERVLNADKGWKFTLDKTGRNARVI